MFYDRSRQNADIGEFARLREEPRLYSLKDVEDDYAEMERACDLLADLIIHRNRANAETADASVPERDEALFRESIKEAMQDLRGPVERRMKRAWRSPDPHGVSERRTAA